MSGRIPDNILEDILSKVDIVEIISSYIPLKRTGNNFKACCPFHQEKTPSFMVSADRQIYHCFGCGESGNAFKFLMRYERMDFPEVVEVLAKKAGVIIPQAKKTDSAIANTVTQLYKINELACLFYQNNLNSSAGSKAKDYLIKRGVSVDTINNFKIGLALDSWDSLIKHLRARGFSLSLLEKVGLIVNKEGGGYYDRFRNRIIFPVLDIKSRVLGFGARVMDESLPKYINSPETQVYTKGRHLYGLGSAKENIRDKDYVVIVEGYLDFIMPFQQGLNNIVASLGTALTSDQARLLKRYTNNVVMIYDPDTAGELAALRSLDIFIEENMNVKVVSLPSGFDPDLFVRKNGIKSLNDMVGNAKNLFDYKLGVLKLRFNHRNIEDKARIVQYMLQTLVKIKDAVLKSEYVKKLAHELDVREEAVWEEMRKLSSAKPLIQSHRENIKRSHINPTEKLLIKLMLEENDLINQIRQNIQPADFQNEKAARIVSLMFELVAQGKNIEPHILISHLGDEDISQIVCESMFMTTELSDGQKERIMNDCINRIKNEQLKIRKNNLHEQIKLAQRSGDENQLQRLMEEFNCLITKR